MPDSWSRGLNRRHASLRSSGLCKPEVTGSIPVRSIARHEPTRSSGGVTAAERQFEVRLAADRDRVPLARLFAAVAEERDGIATEPPVDVDAWAARWRIEGTLVAEAGGEVIGSIHVEVSRFGFGEIGMAVARDWRGHGVGSALLTAAIDWAREQGLHKLVLGVFPHNAAGLALYRKHGFVEEGYRARQYRRSNGELWDSVEMGLVL